MLGHEAALWFPTGTMANQVAIRTLTRPGDEVVVPREAHVLWHETGGAAANSGVQVTEIGPATTTGRFSLDELFAGAKPRGHMLLPPTTVVVVENTHNRAGGVVIDVGARDGHRERGPGPRDRELPRWSAAVECGGRPRRGRGRPRPPVRCRQCGVLERARCAGRLDAGRVTGVHRRARPAIAGWPAARCARSACSRRRRSTLSTTISSGWSTTTPTPGCSPSASPRVRRSSSTRPPSRRTSWSSGWPTPPPMRPRWSAAAREAGVLVVAFSARTIRAVTHLDVTREQVVEAAERLVAAAESTAPA